MNQDLHTFWPRLQALSVLWGTRYDRVCSEPNHQRRTWADSDFTLHSLPTVEMHLAEEATRSAPDPEDVVVTVATARKFEARRCPYLWQVFARQLLH